MGMCVFKLIKLSTLNVCSFANKFYLNELVIHRTCMYRVRGEEGVSPGEKDI
jgi:hypothetical protein